MFVAKDPVLNVIRCDNAVYVDTDVTHQLIYQYVDQSLTPVPHCLIAVHKFHVVYAAVAEVLNVILSVVTTFAPVVHQQAYQYVLLLDNQYNKSLACDRLLAVFAAVTDVLNVSLSVVATLAQLFHHIQYQYVVQSLDEHRSYLTQDKSLAVFNAKAQVLNVIRCHNFEATNAQLTHHKLYQYVDQSLIHVIE